MLRLVAFDMDGTLVDVASSWGAVHAHYGLSNAGALARFLRDEIDDVEFIRSDVELWQARAPGIRREDLERILAAVPLMPGARELVAGLKERGIRTAIVSGGIDLLAERLGRELGFDAVRANGIRTRPDGTLTPEGIVRVPIKGKDRVLAELQREFGVGVEETASVGNSEIDIAMFRRSRIGIAFRPEDEATRARATHVLEGPSLAEALPILLSSDGSGPGRTDRTRSGGPPPPRQGIGRPGHGTPPADR
ncbi:MAG: HAD-IB family phosphatase [Thermoplasmata archaeon]